MKNYKLDQTLLPEIWLTWMSKDGRIWMDKHGNKQDHAECWMNYDGELSLRNHHNKDGKTPFGLNWATHNKDKIWINAGSKIHYAYAKYHEDIDKLEIAVVKYDTTRGDGEHEWAFAGDRLFVGKDKSIVNQFGIVNPSVFTIKRGHEEQGAIHAIQAIVRQNTNDNFLSEFKKLLGCNFFIIGNGTSVPVQYGWQFTKWFQSKTKTRTKGKSQKLVDELIQIQLGEIDDLSYKFPVRYEHEYRSEISIPNVIYFERVNDEWSVLRGLIRNDKGILDEVWRAYIGDDGTNQIATNSNGEWVSSAQPKGYWFRKGYYLANISEAEEKCNRIKYIMPIFRDANDLDALLTTLKFPIIEQLYKLGCKKMALCIARSNTPKSTIKEMFGGYYQDKEKSVLRQIGMTKQQLDSYYNVYVNRRYGRCSVIKIVRDALGADLSHTDHATYDKYLDAVDGMIGNYFYGIHIVDSLDVDKSRFWKNVVRLGEKNDTAYRLISDALSEYCRLDEPRPTINWIFDDYSDVVRTHDTLMALRQEQENAYRAYRNMEAAELHRLEDEKRKKVDESRKHYEYEDENFIIRLPNDVNEIVSEGSRQNICIGGYTTRHSNGNTNLFFLRRKCDETVPFYAIEMSNNKNIVQIHGFGNKWLGNNPEAIPTVVRWLRKNNIKCDNKILTCTAHGYGRTNNYIAMPKVD